MNITIVGSGYVGLVTGACFADVGHDVICVDNNLKRIETLRQGLVPIYEPGLEDIIRHNVSAHRLSFTTDLKEAVARSQVIFIAVPTPPLSNGNVNLFWYVLTTQKGWIISSNLALPRKFTSRHHPSPPLLGLIH
jgi:UDPglucose 6-dehydrogenase